MTRDSGFTLIELLVAVTLLSLLSLILLDSLRLGVTSWRRGTMHSESTNEALVVQSHLRRLIGDTYPRYVSVDPTRGHVDFDGGATSLNFLASTPIALGGAGRSRFGLSVERHEQRSDLVLVAYPELGDREHSAFAAKRALLANIESVQLSYFGKTRSDNGAAWHDQWTGQATLPQLVRVMVRFPKTDARLWPELLLTPRISADVGCVYDPLSKQCRGR